MIDFAKTFSSKIFEKVPCSTPGFFRSSEARQGTLGLTHRRAERAEQVKCFLFLLPSRYKDEKVNARIQE